MGGEGDGGGGGGASLLTLARVLKERWGGGGGLEGGLSPYFNSCLIRVLAAKHFHCSSPTAIHITSVCTCNSCWKMVAPHYGVFSSK